MAKFSEVLTIVNGRNQSKVKNPNGRYPIYGSGGIMGYADDYICHAETVVVGRKGSINQPIFVETPFWNVDTAFGLEANKKCLLPKYLFYFCNNFDFENLSTTVTIPSLTKANLLKIEIPLPSLRKQNQIIAAIDKVTDLISLRKQQLAKLDDLVKSRFIEMFGNFVSDKERWPCCVVGDIANTIDPQPSHRTPPIFPDGVPYVGIAECDYSSRKVDFKSARKVSYDVLDEHIKRYSISEGDFIIGKIGTIGKPFYIPAKQNYTLSANTVLIKPNQKMIVPQFLFALFQSEYMDRIIDAEKKSTSQPAFGIQKVRNITIPLPPMMRQLEFATFVAQVDKSKLAVNQSLEKLETLKNSLMQQYFG